jgi:membrane protein DedA with SNARE-associated domain
MDPTTTLIALAAGALGLVAGYLVGRITGKKVERRRWRGRVAGEAGNVSQTLANVRRALGTHPLKPNG